MGTICIVICVSVTNIKSTAVVNELSNESNQPGCSFHFHHNEHNIALWPTYNYEYPQTFAMFKLGTECFRNLRKSCRNIFLSYKLNLSVYVFSVFFGGFVIQLQYEILVDLNLYWEVEYAKQITMHVESL